MIATGNTERQTQAIEDAIYQDLKHSEDGRRPDPAARRGRSEGRWILMDYLDAVVHVFTPAARDYYRLETLWGEVPELEVERRRSHAWPGFVRQPMVAMADHVRTTRSALRAEITAPPPAGMPVATDARAWARIYWLDRSAEQVA